MINALTIDTFVCFLKNPIIMKYITAIGPDTRPGVNNILFITDNKIIGNTNLNILDEYSPIMKLPTKDRLTNSNPALITRFNQSGIEISPTIINPS